MKANSLSSTSLLLIATLLLAACSPVKLTSIEKRRYRDGYHVQMKQSSRNKDVSIIEASAPKPDDNKSDISAKNNGKAAIHKTESKQIKSALKTFKKSGDRKQLISKISEIADKSGPYISNKNLAATRSTQRNNNKESTVSPQNMDDFGTGTSAIVLLVLFLVIFLLLMEPIVAILIAVLLALLIVWMLRELNIID